MPPQHKYKTWTVPERLAATCRTTPEGTAWLERLPDALRDVARRWVLTLGKPFDRCEPGTALRTLPEPEQDLVIARLLRRLWRAPVAPHPFRWSIQ